MVFQIILSVAISWLLCWILTMTDVFPNDRTKWGYEARTDLRSDALYSAPWFRLPYPGQLLFCLFCCLSCLTSFDTVNCFLSRSNVCCARQYYLFEIGQWGLPTVSLSAVCAILSGVLATTVESVGDYHACAKLAGAPPPPLHAVNRGK